MRGRVEMAATSYILAFSSKGGQLVAHLFYGLGFSLSSPERRRVAEAGQGISARTV